MSETKVTPIDTTRLRAPITDDELRALREMLAEGHPCDITNAMAYNALPALLDEVERLRALVAPPVEGETEPRKVVIWHHRKDDEELPGGDDVDEAIYNAIHAAAWGMCGELKRPDMLEETITVYGFARMQPTLAAWCYLESAIEDLDEEHGSPDGPFKATPAMVAASEAFARTMEREYVSWACEVIETRVVNVREWCAAHRPDWLAQLPAIEPEEGGTR